MPTKLDKLLEEIDPSRIIDIMDARVNNAMNSFHYTLASMAGWDEFQKCLTDFLCHIEHTVFNINVPRYTELDWHHCCQILESRYGRNGGKGAFEAARTGNEGGLYAVLKVLAQGISNKYIQNEISGKVAKFREALSTDEFLEASDEYLEKYKKILPSEITENSAARIKANFTKVLERHPWMIHDMRRVGR